MPDGDSPAASHSGGKDTRMRTLTAAGENKDVQTPATVAPRCEKEESAGAGQVNTSICFASLLPLPPQVAGSSPSQFLLEIRRSPGATGPQCATARAPFASSRLL
jgi:hypothetical protein